MVGPEFQALGDIVHPCGNDFVRFLEVEFIDHVEKHRALLELLVSSCVLAEYLYH